MRNNVLLNWVHLAGTNYELAHYKTQTIMLFLFVLRTAWFSSLEATYMTADLLV